MVGSLITVHENVDFEKDVNGVTHAETGILGIQRPRVVFDKPLSLEKVLPCIQNSTESTQV